MPVSGRLSILIPVYNEMETIERVIRAAARARLPQGIERELIVVDDGSIDATARVLAGLDPALPLRVVRLSENRGKGAAIREGIRHARGDWILIQDGDLEYDPSCYFNLVDPLARGAARVVYGSRFLGTIERMGWQYRLVNRLLVLWTNLLYRTRITDEATAYKAFEAKLLQGMRLRCRRFEFCPEVTGKLCRSRVPIHEVPVRYLGRTKAEGKKIRWYDAVVAFAVLFRERFARPRAAPAPPDAKLHG